jgi:hypothetical protein
LRREVTGDGGAGEPVDHVRGTRGVMTQYGDAVSTERKAAVKNRKNGRVKRGAEWTEGDKERDEGVKRD